MEDYLSLNVYNAEKKTEVDKEKMIEEQIRNREEAIKVVQKEQLI
jgi:hypothetical protein